MTGPRGVPGAQEVPGDGGGPLNGDARCDLIHLAVGGDACAMKRKLAVGIMPPGIVIGPEATRNLPDRELVYALRCSSTVAGIRSHELLPGSHPTVFPALPDASRSNALGLALGGRGTEELVDVVIGRNGQVEADGLDVILDGHDDIKRVTLDGQCDAGHGASTPAAL